MKSKIKKYLTSSLPFILLCLSNTTSAQQTDPPIGTHLPLTHLPESDPGKTGSYYNRGYTFSHDSRLFALFQSGKEVSDSQYTESTLRIWDTQTGQLKYQTILPQYEDSHLIRATPIAFSLDNKVLFRSGGRRADMFIWPFTQSDEVKLICSLGNLNDIQSVTGISNDKQQFLVSGVEYESVCRLSGSQLDYQKINTQRLWGAHTKVLHNDRLLVIHNIRSTKTPETDTGYSLDKEVLNHIDFWDINFSSEANFLLQETDHKGHFFIIEVLDNQLTINQWDYTTRKWLGKQSFKNIQAHPRDKESLNTYFSDNYLLLQANNQITLFQRDGGEFSFAWHKNIPAPTEVKAPLISFSSDEQYIVLGDLSFDNSDTVALISARTGQVLNHYDGKRSKGSTIVTEPLVNSFPNQPLDANCPETAKSRLYSLVSNKSQEINGHALAMSPDGKVLAVCKGRELFLLKVEN